MGNVEVTNFLLTALLMMIGFIGQKIYSKVEKIEEDISKAAVSHAEQRRDLSALKSDVDHLEVRIDKLDDRVKELEKF